MLKHFYKKKKIIIALTSEAKESLFISPPEIPFNFPGTPMMVFWHLLRVNYNLNKHDINTLICYGKKFNESYSTLTLLKLKQIQFCLYIVC